MNNPVKIKAKIGGHIITLPFWQAKLVFKDMLKPFELADKGYKFENNELIKRPGNTGTKKSKESKGDSGGEKVPK